MMLLWWSSCRMKGGRVWSVSNLCKLIVLIRMVRSLTSTASLCSHLAPTLLPLCLRPQPHIILALNTCTFIHTRQESLNFTRQTFETVNIINLVEAVAAWCNGHDWNVNVSLSVDPQPWHKAQGNLHFLIHWFISGLDGFIMTHQLTKLTKKAQFRPNVNFWWIHGWEAWIWYQSNWITWRLSETDHNWLSSERLFSLN